MHKIILSILLVLGTVSVADASERQDYEAIYEKALYDWLQHVKSLVIIQRQRAITGKASRRQLGFCNSGLGLLDFTR